jgi:pimeloyl-ACP methyl ester carboxylesterase
MPGLRARRDVLLVDYRGTGESAPLNCPGMQGTGGAQGFLDSFLPADKVRSCWAGLAKERDLSQYTSDTAVDDIEEVRQALGYGKLNLMGGSYGTRAVLVYLRRHPESVRTATLLGVYPTQEKGPLKMARSAQEALDGLVAECATDAACHGAFPKLKEEIAAVLARTARDPVTVELTDPETGKPMSLRLNESGVAQTLRYMLYVPTAAAQLPLSVHLAAQGDYQPLAETAYFFATNLTSMSDGFYLSVTCAEDLPSIGEAEIAPAVAGTYLGDFRIRQQQAACKAWPVPASPASFREPVKSDVPTILFSGERDPVTPKRDADLAAETLSHSRHFVIPDGAHGMGGLSGLECLHDLLVSFVETAKPEALDAACLAKIGRPEFVLTRAEDVQLAEAELDRLTGTFSSRELGFAVTIERVGGRLRATVASQPPILLVPLSPTRFRLEGLPGGFLFEFQLADGRAESASFQQPGQPAQTLTRE